MAEIARLYPERMDEVDEVRSEAMTEAMRIAEALIFAASEPVDEADIAKRAPEGVDMREALEALRSFYSTRGINLVRVNKRWTFRTASDLGWLLSREQTEQRKLSRAAIETLAIVAYHQPVTRAEIEDIRGVAISKGTLDVLMETSWVRLRGRRKAPGRPVTYGTTDAFLLHFGLETISDLPGLEELKSAGLFDGRLPPGFGVPQPRDDSALQDDEDPLEDNVSPSDLFAEEQAAAEQQGETAGAESAELEGAAADEAEVVADLAERDAEFEAAAPDEIVAVEVLTLDVDVAEAEESEPVSQDPVDVRGRLRPPPASNDESH